jgi:RNA polymerase sigma factor (sigma-70 family)
MSDERLAQMVARGSERAFVTLYERHAQPLYRYCRSIVGNDADAQDALQSAFAAALVALRRGGRDAPLRPWLFRITHNEAVSLLRRRRPVVELTEGTEAAAPSAADRALERERLTLLVSDLRELGDRQRGALVMRELSGLSHAEIALALGTSEGAAKQAIFEARRALLDLREGRAMACEEVRRMISDGDRRVLRARRVRGHLRACDSCAAFAAAIPARRADLQALAPPIAPLAASGVLAGVLGGSGSGHAGGGAGWLVAGATGKSAAAALVAKTAVGVVVLATATVGVTRVLQPAKHARAPASRPGTVVRGSAAPTGTARGHAGGAGRTQATGSAGHAGSRPPTAEHGKQARGRGSSKERLSSGHSGGNSHTPVRGARRQATKVGAGKPAGHRGQRAARPKAGPPAGGRERTSPGLGAKAPTHGNGPAALGEPRSTTAVPAPPAERLREPAHPR